MIAGKLLPLFGAGPPDAAVDRGSVAEATDDEIMLLVREGRRSAFDELVRRHQRGVLNVAAHYAHTRDAARDVAQSSFLELFRAALHYEARGAFRSFLYCIVLNQCRMNCRSARAEERRSAAAAVQRLDDLDPETSAATLLARERNRDVERAIDRLSDKLRAVVVLRYGAELPLQEIATVLRLPLGTIKRRLFDALVKLREIMEDES